MDKESLVKFLVKLLVKNLVKDLVKKLSSFKRASKLNNCFTTT